MNDSKLIPADKKWWVYILIERNQQRKWFVDQETITLKEHEEFMERYHEDYYVITDSSETLFRGFLGVVEGDVRICISRKAQGKGLGTWALKETLSDEKFANARAIVKRENESSYKIFERAGYELDGFDESFWYFVNKK